MDIVETGIAYMRVYMQSIWSRNDLSDTSIMKLSTNAISTAMCVQDVTTGMWQYIILILKL